VQHGWPFPQLMKRYLKPMSQVLELSSTSELSSSSTSNVTCNIDLLGNLNRLNNRRNGCWA
jgi:hypothetical protein